MAYCDKYIELISAAIDGALSPAEESRLSAHLAQCPDCKTLYDDFAVLHAVLTDLPPAETPAGLTERVMAAVAGSQVIPFEKKKSPIHWQRWLASAAVLAVVLVGTWSWKPWEKTSGDLTDSEAFPQAAEIVTTEAGGAADVMPEEVQAAKDEPEAADVSNGHDSGSEDTDAFDPRSVSFSGTSASAKVAIGGIPKYKGAAATADSFDEDVPAEPEEEEAAIASPMARTVTGGSGGDGISAFALPTEAPAPSEAPAAASYKMELFMADDMPVEEAGVEEALEMTPRQALDLVVERCFGNSGYEMFREDLEDDIPSCYVSLMDNGVLVTDGTIVYTGETEDFFLFECHWGDIPEEPYHYSVHKTEGYVAWQGEVPIDGEFRP